MSWPEPIASQMPEVQDSPAPTVPGQAVSGSAAIRSVSAGTRPMAGLWRTGRIAFWEGAAGLAGFIILWQMVVLLQVPLLGALPAPLAVAQSLTQLAGTRSYWASWWISGERVLVGFLVATLLAVPFGLMLGISKVFRNLTFPIFEVLRPVPPLAWVPLSILFWPTREQSIVFIIFIGAFFTIVINVVGGVAAIDPSYIQAARSLGAGQRAVFWRIVLPATLPSAFTGMTVAMGVTWNVLVAAEIIAWEAYVNGALPTIVAGMVSIGIAGMIFSSLIRALGRLAMPWLKH
ncbi:MAG: ABC transporter permease [Chloroflexota bacterium]